MVKSCLDFYYIVKTIIYFLLKMFNYQLIENLKIDKAKLRVSNIFDIQPDVVVVKNNIFVPTFSIY